MVRHLATSMLLVGCSDVLGIPDDPYVLPPDAAAFEPGSSSMDEANVGGAGAATTSAASDAATMNTLLGPAPGIVTDSADGGVAIDVAPDRATRPPNVEVMSTGEPSPPPDCPPIERPLISDFAFSPGGSSTSAYFGAEAALQGGTYFYPSSGSLSSDVSEGNWHLSGTVDTISGLGLYTSGCQPIDASGFAGIAFTLWGTIDGDRPLVFYIESADQQVSSVWLNANKADPADPDVPPNFGRCTPTTGRYDGSCREPRVMLTVTNEPTSVEIPWPELIGGSPVPTIDPGEITAIAWALPAPGDTSYAFDIHIDDLRFIAP